MLFSGDGGPATSALLDAPVAVTLDSSGNLFVSDGNNLRIRKVSPNGEITTVAGNGTVAVTPGPATSSGFRLPVGLAADLSGNIYIADRDDFQILKVTPAGMLSTFYVSGTKPYGLAADGTGNVYASFYQGSPQVVKISPSGRAVPFAGSGTIGFSGDNGPATNAQLMSPSSLCFDGGANLYIADGQRVRKVSPAGTITTVAGNGAAGFAGDGGPAVNASLTANGVAVDSLGNLYIADISQQRIRMVAPDGIISTVAGNGIAAFFGDGGAAASASFQMGLSTEGSGIAANANLVGIAIDASGNLYVPDSGNNRIRKVLAAAPSFVISPSNLTLSLGPGVASGSAQTSVSSSITGLVWTASASAPWITLAPTSGTTPGALVVTIDTSSLPAGESEGSITIASPLASPPMQTMSVIVTVQARRFRKSHLRP
jgi:sugar lactone lactonase YvrE